MPYLFDPSKLNYSGNKVAVRNLISVCNGYEEIYSNIRAQLTLAKDSVNSWYSVWNGAFQRTDVVINSYDPEHKQFLKQLGIILDLFYNNISSILATCSVPITMQYDYNTFTYYVPVNSNMFKKLEIAVKTLANLEINCTDDVVALKDISLNSSTINRSLLFEYNLTESTIQNTDIENQDISGYKITDTLLNVCFIETCDISRSFVNDSYIMNTNFRTLDVVTRGDLSNCTVKDTSLNNCNVLNSDISFSTIYDTHAKNSTIKNSYSLNSYFNNCSKVADISGDSLYLFNVNDCSGSKIANSDFEDVSLNKCKLYMDSFKNCTFRISCDISNSYIINSDISNATIINSNINYTKTIGGTLTACIIIGSNSKSITSVDTKGIVKNAFLSGSDLSGVTVTNCDVSGCQLFNCRLVNNYNVKNSTLIECTGTGNQIYKSFLYPYTDNDIVQSFPVKITSKNINFSSNFFRTLRLKYLVGRLNNIGCYSNTDLTYDYINDISESNCIIGGRYFYKIGDFTTEVISVNLEDKTIADVFYTVIGSGNGCVTRTFKTIPTPVTQWEESVIYELNNNPIVEVFSRMMDEINFSSGLLEDSRNLFNALL
jgi:uncharacterized protein YjbI with pentapeptide repeats